MIHARKIKMKKREAQYIPGLVVFSLGMFIAAIFKLESLFNVYLGMFVGVVYCEFMYQHEFRKRDNKYKED